MFLYVRHLTLNDDDPDIRFIGAEVVFIDDEKRPHKRADVSIYIGKDEKMTIAEIKTFAVEKAREFLSYLANFPQNEYHRQRSDESASEEVF